MTPLLLSLSLRGTLAFLVAEGIDRLVGNRIACATRRMAWLLAGAAFLIPWHLSLPQGVRLLPPPQPPLAASPGKEAFLPAPSRTAARAWLHWLVVPWAAGAAGFLGVATFQTAAASRRWAGERLSTDSRLLSLLEDTKAEARVRAPIGLVVSPSVPTPALLGWLRPRLLLPAPLAANLSPDRLRAVFLHELAHFRSLDLPANLLFVVVRALHWFNPTAHLAARSWARVREEAADAAALRWMEGDPAYGKALLETVRLASGAAAPWGAIGLGESARDLKRRIVMIGKYRPRSPYSALAACGLGLLALVLAAFPLAAQNDAGEKEAALTSAAAWLHGIDTDAYAASWDQASHTFRAAVTRTQWKSALDGVRTPLGRCLNRKAASALHQTTVPTGQETLHGDFYILQYDSSFENLKDAVETISLEKESDGTWRAAGYFIKPRL